MSQVLINKPSLIPHKELTFLIMDAPCDANIKAYINVLKQKNAVMVVQACKPSYDPNPLISNGIEVKGLAYQDGEAPPADIVAKWLDLVEAHRGSSGVIAVHCVAGLGRAPILVAIALLEFGMPALDVIRFIRKKRKGAFNKDQITFLNSYQPRRAKSCCIIA